MKRYRKVVGTCAVAMFLLLITLIILTSCNPYNKLGKRPPLTSKDSTKLATACVATFPIDTSTKVKVDTFYKKGADSTEYFKAKADSFAGVKSSEQIKYETKYRDTCKGALKDLSDHCVTCFNNGYAAGKKERQVPDTVYYNITKTITQERTDKLNVANSQIKSLTKEKDKEKEGRKTWKSYAIWTWVIILICILAWFGLKKMREVNKLKNKLTAI